MISDFQNYRALVEDLFGTGSATFAAGGQGSNNVIGALNHLQFDEFKKNFLGRLRRLANAVNRSPNLKGFVLKAVNEVASSRNWDGAYAELAALDFMLSNAKIDPTQLALDKSSSAAMTMATNMDMSNVDHDFYLRELDLYFDVKILSDKTGQIVDGVVQDALKAIAIKDLRILSFFDVDVSYVDVQKARGPILTELIGSFANGAKPQRVKSKIIPSLEFQPVWKPGVYIREGSYDPDIHASSHHVLLFQHAKKFHRLRPTLIIFVHFPWASEFISPLSNSSSHFFKGLASNFFSRHRSSMVKAKALNSKFVTDISAHQVTRHLAGIVFLNDHCILGDCGNESATDAYFYMNAHYVCLTRTLRVRYLLSKFATNLRALNSDSEWSPVRRWLLRIFPV